MKAPSLVLLIITIAISLGILALRDQPSHQEETLQPHEINLKTFSCEAERSASHFFAKKVFVFSMPNQDTVEVLEDKHNTSFYGFEGKKYLIRYENFYGQKIDTLVEIDNHQTPLLLCLDYFEEGEKASLLSETIKSGKEWELRAEQSGCFHKNSLTIKVYKKDSIDAFFLNVYDQAFLKIETILWPRELRRLELFEQKIRKVNSGGFCTTKTKFYVRNDNDRFSVKYDACSWDCMRELYDIVGESIKY